MLMLKPLDQLRRYQVFEKPIFILSAPRSGSTFLFDILCQFPQVWAWTHEMDLIWWNRFPYHRWPEASDYVGGAEYTSRRASLLRRDLYRTTLWSREIRGLPCGLREKIGLRRVRYLDKTIANCFHLEFLKKAFPDALYIFLLRDGRATVSSMMEGWRKPRPFWKPQLKPFIEAAKSRITHWCYPAPPGWTKVLDRSLEEICAWSWCQHVQTAARELEEVPSARKLVVRYEDLVASPGETAKEIGKFCDFAWRPEVAAFAEKRPLSRTTVSAPEATKWQRLHGKEIERVLPMIAPVMAELGYEVLDLV